MRAILLASLLALAGPVVAAPDVGFESGDTSGWTVSGNAGAATSWGSFSPAQGQYLGYVQAGDADIYSTLTRSFWLAAGRSIRGRVGFQTSDYLPWNDDAYLSVNGTNIATFDVALVGDGGNSGWQDFIFTAPTAGTYTLQLGVRNIYDNSFSSSALLDSAVPEPSTWVMLVAGFGLVGLGARGRDRRVARVSA